MILFTVFITFVFLAHRQILVLWIFGMSLVLVSVLILQWQYVAVLLISYAAAFLIYYSAFDICPNARIPSR